jgi:hypothetical protein
VTRNYGFRLAQAISERYGLPGYGGWPAIAEHASPFLCIVVDTLGVQESSVWFDSARRAHAREAGADRARTHHFGFAHYLTMELGDFEHTLARTAAWEALNAVHELARQNGTDLDALLDCAERAAARSLAPADPVLAASGTPQR